MLQCGRRPAGDAHATEAEEVQELPTDSDSNDVASGGGDDDDDDGGGGGGGGGGGAGEIKHNHS